MSRLLEAGSGLFNLAIRIVYVPFAIISWIFLVIQSWKAILALFSVGLIFYGVSLYGGTIVSAALNTMQNYIAPIYVNIVRPILSGIIRTFFNPIVCWYDGFVIFPYAVGRNVIFPILREGGLLQTIQSFANFIGVFAKDFFLGYFVTGQFLYSEFDYSGVFASWQIFMGYWQNLWCFGCTDLCPVYTMTINPIVSDQLKDTNFGDFLGKSFNGWMVVYQQIIFVTKQVLFPTQPTLPYLNFNRAFQLWCEAGTGLRISFENILQEFWDAFVPYHFVWRNFLCFTDTIWCIVLRFINFNLNLVIHADSVLSHFKNTNSTYWNNNIRLEYEGILNLFGPADYFDPIIMDITNITSYQLLTRDQGAPNGGFNPVYNMTTLGECFCIALTRLLCDPEANGTTCAQQYNGTLIAGIDPCCLTTNSGILIANSMATLFEFSLHLMTVSDFIQFTNDQPFTTQIKFSIANTINCIWQIFRVVRLYGFCIERIFAELTNFITCTLELTWRVGVALLTTPYWNEFLPGQCNFITCPGPNNALDMALLYLDRVSNPDLPDGLVNCFCFTLNNGFNVPFAGCGGIPCTPTGFLNTTNISKKLEPASFSYRERYTKSLYEQFSPTGRFVNRIHHTPDFTFTLDASKYKRASSAFFTTFNALDIRFEKFNREIGRCGRELKYGTCASSSRRTLISLNITDQPINCTNTTNPTPNPVPCFGLCCLPVKLVQLTAHFVAFSARAINGAFQTRFGNSSSYWNGQACMQNMPCFQSDLTMLIVKSIAPVDCLCQFIKLLLPQQGFGDPCCAFTVLGELISCALQILINIGNSIAGDPEFLYIKGNSTMEPQIIADFDIVLELSLDLFDCICNFVRTIFAVAFSGTSIEKSFDPCCIARVYVRGILELLRLLFRVVISLSTLDQVESQCYMYVNGYGNARPACKYAIEDLPVVIQFKKITSILLAPPVTPQAMYECSATANLDLNDPDAEGLPTCICRLLNAVLAMVNKVDANFTGDLNAQPKCLLNLCCPIYAAGQVLKTLGDFFAEVIATFWQNWEFKRLVVIENSIIPESFFIPQETLNFFFCDEYGTAGCNDPMCFSSNPSFYPGYMPLTDNQPIGTSYSGTGGIINSITQYNASQQTIRKLKCGKIEPALQALKNLLGGCMCASGNFTNMNQGQLACGINNFAANGPANVLDALIRWFIAFVTQESNLFPIKLMWPSCLCCGGPNPDDPGMVKPFADLVVIVLRQVIGLFRNIANPSYWSGAGGTLTDTAFNVASLTNNFDDLRKTWINRFLAPVADALCRFLTNSGCLLSMILGNTCESTKYDAISSIIRYISEGIIRLLNLIEAAIKMFAQEPPGQCVGKPSATNGNNNRPNDQGSNGQTGVLVPTCSPQAGTEPAFRGVTANKLGGIIVASATFIVDALIGISRFSCSTVCPGLVSDDVNINFISAQTCSCWNDSPYTGVSGQKGNVCGLGLCNCIYNSGRESFVGVISGYRFECPNNTNTCTREEIQRDSLFGTNTAIDSNTVYPYQVNTGCSGLYPFEIVTGCPVFPNRNPTCNAFAPYFNFQTTLGNALIQSGNIDSLCNGGCDARLGDYDIIALNNPLLTWGSIYPNYKFKPALVGLTSLICQIPTLPTMKKLVKKDVIEATCSSCPVQTNQIPNSSPVSQTVDVLRPGVIGDVNLVSFYKNLAKLGQNLLVSAPDVVPPVYGPPYTQPVCDRNFCILHGLCKNDQMVPCSPGTKILDGMFIAALKYLNCLLERLFSGTGQLGSAVGGLFTIVLKLLSFIWQISGGLIRFGVALGLWTFNMTFTFFTATAYALANFIPLTVNLLNTFGAIFTQPLADGYKRDTYSKFNFTYFETNKPTQKLDDFETRFKMTKNIFYKSINLRGDMVRNFYMKEYGIRHDSPVLWPLINLDMYHYKYHTGYYNYLYDRSDFSVENIIGTRNETWNELLGAYEGLQTQLKVTFHPVIEMINEILPELPAPQMPQFFRVIYNGSLKKHFETYLPDFSFPTVKYNPPVFENFTILPRNQVEKKHQNLMKRVLYGLAHAIYPQGTTKSNHERFIVGGNCRIVQGVIDEGSKIADYCLNEFHENVPASRFSNKVGKSEHFQKYGKRLNYTVTGTGTWKRAKIEFIPLEKRVHVHKDTFYRAHHSRNVILNVFGNIFNFDFTQWIANLVNDLIYWLNNPNLLDTDRPNVGARYWAQEVIICRFPSNLDCSLGIGLKDGIFEVAKYYALPFIILLIIFPGFSSILSLFFNLVFFVLLVLLVSWNYSPACIALFPTSTIAGTPYTIPVLPIPLNILPALPMCMWDEIIQILDEIFSTCYEWIPGTLQNNQPCTAGGGSVIVDVPNCSEVGISNPLQSLIYWGYKIFGAVWCDIMIGITSLFGIGGASETCVAIKTASQTQMDRQLVCGIASLGTLAWFILAGYLIGAFIIYVGLAVINVFHAFLLLVPSMPFVNKFIGAYSRGDETSGTEVSSEGPSPAQPVDGDPNSPPRSITHAVAGPASLSISNIIANGIKKTFLAYKRTEKIE